VTNSCWLILRTRPRFELKLETAVQQLGVHAYVPKTITRRRDRHDKRRLLAVRQAIYPGYVFSREFFPAEAVTTTTLSAHWLQHEGKLAQISEALMDKIEAGERIGYAVEEAFDILRCAPITKRMAKRVPFTRDVKSVLGRAA
jgi:hypothetical protein